MIKLLKRGKKDTKVVPRYTGEKVAIFIDGGNMFYATSGLKLKINYKKLVNILRKDRWLLRAYFYTGVPSGDLPEELKEQFRRQQGFLKELQNLGIKVKTMPLKKTPEGYIEKGIDILIATDMVSLAFKNAYDTAILVSGDSDFVPVVEKIQELGKRVENAAFRKTSSYELRRVCDEFILLDNIKHRFTIPLSQEKAEKKKESFWEKITALFSKIIRGKKK